MLHRAAKYIVEEQRSIGLSAERETALRDALVILAGREEELRATETAGGRQARRRKPSGHLVAGVVLVFVALIAVAGYYRRIRNNVGEQKANSQGTRQKMMRLLFLHIWSYNTP